MTPLLASVLLSVASAAAYATAAVLQDRIAAYARQPAGSGEPLFDFLLRGRWWASVGLTGTGALLHVLALVYGPLAVVQPLGVLTLVLALPFGVAAADRRVTFRRWWGAGAIVAGLAVFLALTVPGPVDDGLDQNQAWLVAGVAAAVLLGLLPVVRWCRRPAVRSLLLAVAAGIAFAVGSALTQTVLRQVGRASLGLVVLPLVLALAGMAVAGLLLSQFAYRYSDLGVPLATLTLANPIASTTIAVVVLGERPEAGAWGTLAVVLGCVVAGRGVVLLATSEQPNGDDRGRPTAAGGPGPARPSSPASGRPAPSSGERSPLPDAVLSAAAADSDGLGSLPEPRLPCGAGGQR
ncbi:hypothetical protein GCM10027290_28480 [Micromonospora sonneratiae]|uniref:DMT family transporter n=1 Tax=Micromonospora sonneratiae TaxID=1184706 RepID=A0ABW3Y7A9_9ACTN